MPVVGIPVDLLRSRIATKLDRDALVEQLQYLGCDVEGYATLRRFRCERCENILEITATENPPVVCDRCGTDYREDHALLVELGTTDVIRMELLAVRPDMFDPGGLARVLRAYLDEGDVGGSYVLQKAQLRVVVDPALAGEQSYRPSIACAVVRGIRLDEDLIKAVMKLQENLHWALGRDRKHASIGVYDLDRLHGSRFSYRTVGPEELRFTPLGYDPQDDDQRLTPNDILTKHPKGVAYARLLGGFQRYPLLCDEEGQVLSMPPIINSEQTRITQKTCNFFIDVTGTGERIVHKTLNILVTSLAELDRQAHLECVRIDYSDREVLTPDLSTQRVILDPVQTEKTIGVELAAADISHYLRRMGHEVTARNDGALEVAVPAYRNDIMHPIDLIEDVAIAYGYHNIETSLVPTMTIGQEQPAEYHSNIVRSAMTGMGFFEVLTLLLSSENQQYEALRLPLRDDCVLIKNPISQEQTIVRTMLIPGLLDTFSVNTDHELPQRIFEVGNVSWVDAATETGAREERHLAAGIIGPKADFGAMRSTCEALLRELGWRLEIEASALPSYIAGRGAQISACRNGERQIIGQIGELHPEVLERFRLVHPAVVFEIVLAAIFP